MPRRAKTLDCARAERFLEDRLPVFLPPGQSIDPRSSQHQRRLPQIWPSTVDLAADKGKATRDRLTERIQRPGTGHPAVDFRHTPCRDLAVGKRAVGVSAH